MESQLDRERRDRFDTERENANLESKLRGALNKIEQLTQNFLEMEHRTKMKEQELMSAYARVKDEALQAQRLEQQVLDVSNTLQSMGRRIAVASRY
jgi:predicted nuclease with TOPRIM domain